MVEKLGIDRSKINELGNLLYKNYGTTMAGLRVNIRLFSSRIGIFVNNKRTFSMEMFINDDDYSVLQAIGYDFDYDEYHR